jgi:predicted peptidase
MKKITGLSLLCFMVSLAYSQDLSLYEKKNFIRDGDTLRYRILYPKNYDSHKKYPLVLFLHGAGERGNDNEAQLLHGGSMFLRDSVREKYPAIVIFPQMPKDSSWAYTVHTYDTLTKRSSLTFPFLAPTTPARLAKGLMDSLVSAKKADNKRIYIGGLSMGGFGTFNMLARYPDYFAAAIPICGGGDTAMANRFAKKVAVWIFHGDQDQAVNVENSRNYFHALQGQHARVKYTEYPGVGHNSWDNAFAEKDLFYWLFSNKK